MVSETIDCPYYPYANLADEVYAHLLAKHQDELPAGWRDIVAAIDLFDALEPEVATDRGVAAAIVDDLEQWAASAEANADELTDELDVARAGGRAAAFEIAAEEVRERILEERRA